ncbi:MULTISPECIES: hypothetical protein [Streptomyces]|nr:MULTISPECIES: hypothetical protein [Streptomyces]MDX3515160.1 hypothetical protein [Streptomyces caniscabiei]MDX3638211.1 hypothetical protein [Streptomyces sp. MB09-02B]MDX3716558.1 hypothetical protein [Streptomyces caniscabiei]MDX3732007.1 hypothetical protein [Streptomyces caniscabiei]WEO22450.1 hypothetical protein IHE65_04460 [Streptomyces caniscabiei]
MAAHVEAWCPTGVHRYCLTYVRYKHFDGTIFHRVVPSRRGP